jgi:hypothetical protein
MHRAFAVDVLACPHCGGRLRLIATLHDPAVIQKILAHLGRSPSEQRPGPRRPRPPPLRPELVLADGLRREASSVLIQRLHLPVLDLLVDGGRVPHSRPLSQAGCPRPVRWLLMCAVASAPGGAMSENGRLRQGTGDHPGGDRRVPTC